MKYFIEESTLTGIGDAIREKNGTSDLIPVTALAEAIINLPSGGGEMPDIVISGGSASSMFSGGKESLALTYFPECIRTENLTNCYCMFYSCSDLTEIPFDLNGKPGTICNMQQMFAGCSALLEYPAMYNFKPSITQYLFSGARTRYLPEGIETWDWSNFQTSTSNCNGCFNAAYSLRSIPDSFLHNYWNPGGTGAYTNIYYGYFYDCFCLDEVIGLPVIAKTPGFTNTFYRCARLKDMTFQMEDEVTPKTCSWSGLTIDLTSVGFAPTYYTNYITDYNSGITSAKQVSNDATYQALKDDPDWWTANVNYSRYNHDSAVRTINSLPSNAAGTNTIKFTGAAGTKTDGGAINTLTEEEIAVATAKGWTVSLV
jgi:hypothetical protein